MPRPFVATALCVLLGCGPPDAGDDGTVRFALPGPADADLPTVRLEGMRFRWRVEYPTGARAEELVLPIGRAVRLEIASVDVEHRFVVDGSALRIDAPPEGSDVRRVEALAPATLRSRCAVNCGPDPDGFSIPVRFVPADAYDHFVAALDLPPTDRSMPVFGRELYASSGCGACHGSGETGALEDLPGSVRELEGGESLVLDSVTFPTYVAESITAPRARLVRGEPPVMPTYSLRPVQIDALVAYIACRVADCASRPECAAACEPP